MMEECQLRIFTAILSSIILQSYFIISQTQEEFSLLYLAQARDAKDFPRSSNVHKPSRLTSMMATEKEAAGDGQVKDYPSSLDYREKGHVTSVSFISTVEALS